MPFLLQFVKQIKHQSALNLLTAADDASRLALPFHSMHEAVRQRVDSEWIHNNDVVDLLGDSGSGKTWILGRIVEHMLSATENSVVYIDVDGCFRHSSKTVKYSERLFLFQPSSPVELLAVILGLDHWFYCHPDLNGTCVVFDGAVKSSLMMALKATQEKWGFALLTTTRHLKQQRSWWNYRFKVFKEGQQVKLSLISPLPLPSIPSTSFPVTSA